MKTMTKKKYAELQGLVCPVCGGKDIEGEMVDIDAGYAVQRISCLDCTSCWDDVYILTGYANLSKGDKEQDS